GVESRGSGETKKPLHCTFCGKSQREVRKSHRRPDRFHLRRVRRAVHGHRRRGEQVLVGEVARRHSDPEGDTQSSRRLCHRVRITPRRCSRSRSIITTSVSTIRPSTTTSSSRS